MDRLIDIHIYINRERVQKSERDSQRERKRVREKENMMLIVREIEN